MRGLCVQDSDALSRMQQAILQLQAELDRLSVSTQQLIDDNNNKQKDIDVSQSHYLLSTVSHRSYIKEDSENTFTNHIDQMEISVQRTVLF